jgi:hypothetical protein
MRDQLIEIQGFSRKQRALADIIWDMDEGDQVRTFIRALHPKDRQDAQLVCEMMILAFIDQSEEIDDSVKAVIDNCRY